MYAASTLRVERSEIQAIDLSVTLTVHKRKVNTYS